MSLRISVLSSSHDREVTAFLNDLASHSPSVLAYHYPFYREMLEKLGVGRPHYLGLRRFERLCGYLPLFEKTSTVGPVFCSLPFFGPNGGILCHAEDRAEAHAVLVQELFRLARERNALACSVYTPFLFEEFSLYDELFQASTVVNKFTQFLDLTRVRWSNKIESTLRRAQRASVRITTEPSTERMNAFCDIYYRNCQDYGIPPKPKACIEFLSDDAIRGKFSQIYFATVGDKVIGGLLVLLSPTTVSYYIPCSMKEHRSDQPGALLVDHAIRDAQRKGLRFWNWESSPSRDSGVYAFKAQWGSEEASYRIYVKSFRSQDEMRRLGREQIAMHFPYFFVWPFDQLEAEKE